MSGTAAEQLSKTQAQAVLNSVLGQLHIVLTCPSRVQPGQIVTASLVPASPLIDASDLANGILNLAWLGKDVLFGNASPMRVPKVGDADEGLLAGDRLAADKGNILSGQPFPPPTPILNGGPVANPAGMLGQLVGTLALPRVSVSLRLKWLVTDEQGHILSERRDFVAIQGIAAPSVSLILPPEFREFRLDTLTNPGGLVRCLWAEVTLSLGSETLGGLVGPVPVIVLPILLPTVVALFSEDNFGVTSGGAVVIVVPEHSPLTSAEQLFQLLKRIEAPLSALRGLGGFVGFFLGLDELISSLPEQPRIRFIASNAIGDLEDITVGRRPWYDFLGSDPNFDDRVRSILVFGSPGTAVTFFNDEDFKKQPATDQGVYEIIFKNELLSVPPKLDYCVAIRTLNTDCLIPPVTFPPGRINPATFEPDTSSGNDGLWHTDMTSLLFSTSWLRDVGSEVANPKPDPVPQCASTVLPPQPTEVGARRRRQPRPRSKVAARPGRKRQTRKR